MWARFINISYECCYCVWMSLYTSKPSIVHLISVHTWKSVNNKRQLILSCSLLLTWFTCGQHEFSRFKGSVLHTKNRLIGGYARLKKFQKSESAWRVCENETPLKTVPSVGVDLWTCGFVVPSTPHSLASRGLLQHPSPAILISMMIITRTLAVSRCCQKDGSSLTT